MATFKDLNLKLSIIELLDSTSHIHTEANKVRQTASYTRAYRTTTWNEPIKAMMDYYKNVEIPQELLDKIVVFKPNIHLVYRQVVKEWDGEDQDLYIRKLHGIELLRNMAEFNDETLYQFAEWNSKGEPDISPLLKCPKLKKVILLQTKITDKAGEVIKKLRAKGVSVEVNSAK